MGKYTMRIQEYCAMFLPEGISEDEASVDTLIACGRPQLFNFNFPFYDESEVVAWEVKFMKHFFMYEIGFETPRLFRLALESKLNEIMPAYNKLYTEFNSIIKLNENLNIDETGTRNNTGTSTANSEQKSKGNNQSLFSDTPQSRISIGQNDYVTTITEGTIGDNTNANSTQNVDNVETYSNNRKGNMGNRTNAELFKVASESIVNIDQMIYNECSDLFMLLY